MQLDKYQKEQLPMKLNLIDFFKKHPSLPEKSNIVQFSLYWKPWKLKVIGYYVMGLD